MLCERELLVTTFYMTSDDGRFLARVLRC